jgi:hypothetical protein
MASGQAVRRLPLEQEIVGSNPTSPAMSLGSVAGEVAKCETCLWQVARKSSSASYDCMNEVLGSQNVTRRLPQEQEIVVSSASGTVQGSLLLELYFKDVVTGSLEVTQILPRQPYRT